VHTATPVCKRPPVLKGKILGKKGLGSVRWEKYSKWSISRELLGLFLTEISVLVEAVLLPLSNILTMCKFY